MSLKNENAKTFLRRIMTNETGQMSIFVALIFQVLFVFFAMVINVGLLVHDKINLQNAVDLAVYYAAARQAEILNEIAHVNYQIRQDNKLLAWRYRVLGTLGREGLVTNPVPDENLPPARKRNTGGLDPNTAWINPAYGDELPTVCVSNQMWYEMVKNSDQEENYCRLRYGQSIPKIPSVVVIAPFVPGVVESAGFTRMAQEAQRISCENAGPRNWLFAMEILYAYKLAIATRKQIIWEMRRNLIAADMKDRNTESVKQGVLVTLQKNLTRANLEGFQEDGFQMINGLADANCNTGDEGEFILPEVRIAPGLAYTAYTCNEQGTTPFQRPHGDTTLLDQGLLNQYDGSGTFRSLSGEPSDPKQPYQSSLGFEKNPWCMAYMGVKAKTITKKPFAPFSKGGITLEARAFAQPFGGRIGPWYKSRWTRSAANSAEGERVDPLTPPRATGTGMDVSLDPQGPLPNYSRYPGDTLGLKAGASLGAQNAIIRDYGPPKPKDQRLKLEWYTKFDDIATNGDVLANSGDPNLPLRKAEISAVTPDLFDATYYSVEPSFIDSYINSAPDRFTGAGAVFGKQPKELPDIGGSIRDGTKMTIEAQINNSVKNGGLDQAMIGKLYYVIRDWTHLLTGWVSRRVQTFDFPEERFGKCAENASDKVMIPGKCSAGGRTGYSVRLISRAHLLFSNWKIGGEGEQEGAILNPPAAEF